MARFYAGLGLVAVAGTALIGYLITREKPQPAAMTVDPNLARYAEGYLLGDSTAPVQIMEFADFECPACGQFATVTEPDVRKRLIETGRASLRFFDFPLEQHRNTVAASNAAACAADQGKFWEMHDKLFAGQTDWNTQATSNPKRVFARYAQEIGLNPTTWGQCFDTQKNLRRIQANKAEGERRQVRQTPTFLIGTRMIPGALPFDMLKAVVDSEATAAAVTGKPARADTGAAAGATAGTAPGKAASPAAAPKRP